MIIVSQHGSIELSNCKVFFQACYERLKKDRYFYMPLLIEGSLDHFHWLQRHVHPLFKINRVAYVSQTIQKILEFL